MLIDWRNSTFLALSLGVIISASARAAAPEDPIGKHITSAPLSIAQRPASAGQPRRIRVENPQFVRRSQGPAVSAAGPAPGVTVYRNDFDVNNFLFFTPFDPDTETNEIVGDDIRLAQGACNVVYYEIAVIGEGNSGFPTFNVHTELRTKKSCDPTATLIPGSQADFANVVNDGITVTTLGVTLPAAASAPGDLWLWVSFTAPDAGWVIGEQAELGFTDDLFSFRATIRQPFTDCIFWFNGEPYSGFAGSINCNLEGDPDGACCTGAVCSEMTESECGGSGGAWEGAFTDCDPSPCLTGACCSGGDFNTCSETTELGCSAQDRLFHPLATCDQNLCKPAFAPYVNDFGTGFFAGVPLGAQWADEIHFPPCDELVAFSIDMVGTSGTGDFDVQTELWTNDDRGTLTDTTDDIPLAPIAGTLSLFQGVRADSFPHTLLAGPFPKIPTDGNLWVVFSTTSDDAGPSLGGEAEPGFTGDWFAVIDDPQVPESNGTWVGNVGFPGDFNPDTCPGGANCIPHDSFHITAWCQGEEPKGTCCNDAAGTFVNGVQEAFCDGRWILDPNGNADSFSPTCGLGACCTEFGCTNKLDEECAAVSDEFGIPVSFTGGQLCSQITCPRSECLDATAFGESCFATHVRAGCGDAVCCEAVCGNGVDEVCCDPLGSGWDNLCVSAASANCTPTVANDHCNNAMPIDGVGTFDFDTTLATTDGMPHQGCLDGDDQDHIIGDIWYSWTSPCNDIITVTTCDLSTVDTKLAVYNDSETCPPSDAELIACNDDACTANPSQATVAFIASVGEKKLIRLGMFPTETPVRGAGQFRIQCGAPLNLLCPGTGDCCETNGSGGCVTRACCDAVCAADPSCCTNTWDAACAGTGRLGTGGGAAVLCGACQLGGDLDGSGFIDRADWVLLVNVCLAGPGVAWSNGMCEAADFDGSGFVDMADVEAFMQVFNTPVP
jgi:hypothetical protein